MGLCISRIFVGWDDTADNSGSVDDRTIKVTGISMYLRDVFVKYFQQDNDTGSGRNIDKVFVCPKDKDCVVVQFSIDQDKVPNHTVKLKIDGTPSPLIAEPLYMSSTSTKDEDVKLVWQIGECPIKNSEAHDFADNKCKKMDRDQKRALDTQRLRYNEFHKGRFANISVNALLIRYIRTFHWEVFQELESVSKEINFKILNASDRILNLVSRDEVDTDLFNKKCEQFISCYQKLYQTMYQEVIAVNPNSSVNASIGGGIVSDTRAKFPVIVTFYQETSQITVYGEKSVVLQVCSSINDRVSAVSKVSKNVGMDYRNGQLMHKLSEKVKLIVYQGDITEEKVDAIVNPANQDLRHCGGAAEAILKRGGNIIQHQSDDIMKNRGRPLQPGDVEITTGGKLPCKFIVHAVGPRWSDHSTDACRQLLRRAVVNSLRIASQNKAQTIALPAISSGIFGVPVNVSAEVLFSTVEEFAKTAADSESLQEIRFVNIDKETVQVFQRKMRERYGNAVNIGKEKSNQNGFFMSNGGTNATMGRNQHEMSQRSGGHGKECDRATQQQDNNIRVGGRKGNSNFKPEGQHPQPNPSASTMAKGDHSIKLLPSYSDAKTRGSKYPSDNDAATDTSKCSICLEGMTNPKALPKCGHSFCTECIDNAFKHQQKCPLCGEVYGVLTGNQPPGHMTTSISSNYLPGFKGAGSIIIYYTFHNGTQESNHPNPGRPYSGTRRTAYLPNNKEGQKVLKLLKKAFDQKLTFTIGRSTTTGREDTVTWNDVHHKTSTTGGSAAFGYPDPSYLQRVQEELAAKGIKE